MSVSFVLLLVAVPAADLDRQQIAELRAIERAAKSLPDDAGAVTELAGRLAAAEGDAVFTTSADRASGAIRLARSGRTAAFTGDVPAGDDLGPIVRTAYLVPSDREPRDAIVH